MPYDIPPINSPLPLTSPPTEKPTPTPEFDEYDEEELDDQYPRSDSARSWSSFYAGNPDHSHFVSDQDSMPRRLRNRPTPEQAELLRKLFEQNPHPTTEARQRLADSSGM